MWQDMIIWEMSGIIWLIAVEIINAMIILIMLLYTIIMRIIKNI